MATSLPRPAMEGHTRPPNRLHALASVAAGRRTARCRPESPARARDTSPRCGVTGCALAPHTVPVANLLFEPATEGAIGKSVPLPPARGATEPTKCPLCADKYYTSGAMQEHLAWRAVHAAAPVDDKEAASNILQGRARRSPWHAPYARRPQPQERPRGPAVRTNKGPSPRGWPPWPLCGPRSEQALRTPWPRRTQEPWLHRRIQRRCR